MTDGIDRRNLRGIMGRMGLNITSLSRETGITRVTLSNFLGGRLPSYRTMAALKAALELSPAQMGTLFFADDLRDAKGAEAQ